MAWAKEMSCRFYLCFFLQNVVIFQSMVVGEPEFPCFFIFGDSLVDNGNNNYLQTSIKVNYFPYGIDFPTGPTGRYSNGRNMADFIAKMLGFQNSIPPFANGTSEDFLGGLNYASGGSGILNETGTQYGNVFSLSDQLSNHEMTISRIEKLLGGQSAAQKHLSSCLYYVGLGTNDYILDYLPHLYSANYTPNQFAEHLIAQYANRLRRLYQNGARKVAVVEVGELGCTPLLIHAYASPSSPSCVEIINDVVHIFNRHLKLLTNTLNHDYAEAKFVQARYTTFSAASTTGNIKIVSEPCCVVGTALCVEGSVPCSNRDEYKFWDEVHPTEAAVAATAGTTYNDISPLFLHHFPIYLWHSFHKLPSST